MAVAQQAQYSKEDVIRLGDELYATHIRSQIEDGNHGKIVAIDVRTGAFEVGKNSIDASDRLLVQYPNAQIWFVRIGHDTVHKMRQTQVVLSK
jgi:hypothetical protein